ncbi:MAG TPA: polysaccharide deacetylase family protein [Bdellovibrionota bacterium]|jgi:peptidoglycan/xylan/chitin deacetylase (PgdA/CDA1 family)
MLRVFSLFVFLFAAPVWAGGLTNGLEGYVSAFYLAEGKLADFDNELSRAAQRGLLSRSRHYRELAALRIILEAKGRALKLQKEKFREEERSDFLARLRALGPVERIALQDLVSGWHSSDREVPLFYSSLSEELAAREAARALIQARVAEARRDAGLNSEMRAIALTLDFSKTADEINPLRIQPSPGPDGTISGAGFPDNTWALTYDDGPHDKYSPQVFANLSALGKKASFLWLVECLEQSPGMVAQAKALGLPTNNHSWTHENLDKAAPEVLQKEIVSSTEKDSQFYGERPRFFRLPYGAGLTNKAVRQLIADNGMIHVFWNVDSLDWKDKNPETILARVKKEMALEKHGIILFHDIHPQSVDASLLLLKYSDTLNGTPRALRWVTIPEIVDELNRARYSRR